MPALYDQLLTQAGGRASGTPVARPTSGGTAMQPSQPSYPAPPSPSAGVTGRPSSRPVVPSAPGGLAAPLAPAAPVAQPPAGTGPSGAPRGQRNPTFQPSERQTAPTEPQPQPQPGAPQPPPGSVMLNLNRVPSRRDYVGLLPGVRVNTPYGSAQLGSDGHPVIEFASPEHEARYRNDEANYARQYGPTPFSGMPGAPQPQVRLGRVAYNPYQGRFLAPPSQ